MRKVWNAGDQLTASDLNNSFQFGGTGADGALSISSGTTTLALGSATTFIKNYTSISITGTGILAFSGPNTNGTRIVLRSQGNVTITSTAARAIDLRAMGAAAAGQSGEILDTSNHFGGPGANGSGGGGGGAGGTQITTLSVLYARNSSNVQATRWLFIVPGTGGGAGGNGTGGGTGGSGGAGAGALFIECGGAYNFGASSTIDASGSQGTAGTLSGGTCGGSGGSGSGGMILVLYGSLTADSGTYNVSGGAQLAGTGGAGGTTSGGGGGGGGTTEAAGSSGETTGSALHGGFGGAGANGIAVRIQNQFYA